MLDRELPERIAPRDWLLLQRLSLPPIRGTEHVTQRTHLVLLRRRDFPVARLSGFVQVMPASRLRHGSQRHKFSESTFGSRNGVLVPPMEAGAYRVDYVDLVLERLVSRGIYEQLPARVGRAVRDDRRAQVYAALVERRQSGA